MFKLALGGPQQNMLTLHEHIFLGNITCDVKCIVYLYSWNNFIVYILCAACSLKYWMECWTPMTSSSQTMDRGLQYYQRDHHRQRQSVTIIKIGIRSSTLFLVRIPCVCISSACLLFHQTVSTTFYSFCLSQFDSLFHLWVACFSAVLLVKCRFTSITCIMWLLSTSWQYNSRQCWWRSIVVRTGRWTFLILR